jgi:hypothetical protein
LHSLLHAGLARRTEMATYQPFELERIASG